MTDLPERIFANRILSSMLNKSVDSIVRYQRHLSYSQYRTHHRAKYATFRRLDPMGRRLGRPLIREKGYRDHPEFVGTVELSPELTARSLSSRLSYHLLSTAKRRRTPWGLQYSHAHLVRFHDDGMQTEVYLFDLPNGDADVYAHLETSVTDPENHHEGKQTPGDPRDVIGLEALSD